MDDTSIAEIAGPKDPIQPPKLAMTLSPPRNKDIKRSIVPEMAYTITTKKANN